MKNFEILLNNKFTASTQAITSGLDLINDYYVYIIKNGGGIVNQYNVRGYLNDIRNQQITTDFFAFLTGNTSQDQTLSILNSDKKLSDVFNDYYQRIILSASQTSNTAVIQQNLTGSNQTIGYSFNHPWSGFSPSKQLTGITQSINGSINKTQSTTLWNEFTTEQSYFIPVNLERGTNQLSKYKHDICDVFINSTTAGFYPEFSGITASYFKNIQNNSIVSTDTRLHTILNCFVDINLETNENKVAQSSQQKLSFQFDNYNINEGDSVQVRIALDSPSISGIEQATIGLYASSINVATYIQDFVAIENYPITLSWSAGEQYKFLSFITKKDFYFENTESFLLRISNLINLDPGTIINTNVNIIDSTILRKVSLSVLPPTPISPTSLIGVNSSTISEGGVVDLTVTLDGPAFGVESVELKLVSTATVAGGTIGPVANPAIVDEDFIISASSLVFNFAVGETQKTFRFSAKTDNIIENPETALFEIQNTKFCIIDQAQQVVSITINDTTGAYKYVHLNLGNIYSELGNNGGRTQAKKLILPFMSNNNLYPTVNLTNFSETIIKYGDTFYFRTSQTSGNDTLDYNTNKVKVKITNTGTIQSIINNIAILPGQNIILPVSGNSYVLTATTNDGQNVNTNFFDYANYKIELINDYSGTTEYHPTNNKFTLRATNNTSAATNSTLSLGTYLLSGTTTLASNITNQYKLKSKYSEIYTGRVNVGTTNNPVYACPLPTDLNFDNTIENISIHGILFLNFQSSFPYTAWPSTHYEGFEFVQTTSLTCGEIPHLSNLSGVIDYATIPFKVEP